MARVTLEVPEDLLPAALALDEPSAEAVEREVLMLLAIKLFELGRISSGAAAHLAGVPRVLFLQQLGDYGVDTFDLTDEELEQDLAHARRHS